MDLRFAKVVRFGRTRTDVGIDLWNLFNTNYATAYEGVHGDVNGTWQNPTSIYAAAVRAPELHGRLLNTKDTK